MKPDYSVTDAIEDATELWREIKVFREAKENSEQKLIQLLFENRYNHDLLNQVYRSDPDVDLFDIIRHVNEDFQS